MNLGMYNRFSNLPRRHRTVTPSNTDALVTDYILYCTVAGTAAVVDKDGVQISYTLVAGDIVPVIAWKVMATGTTATLVGLY
jgi:hypothetical protein